MPASRASIVESSSASRSIKSASLRRSFCRLVPGVVRHDLKAIFACWTARSISEVEAAEIKARREPLAGLRVSRVLLVVEGTNVLFMKRPVGTVCC